MYKVEIIANVYRVDLVHELKMLQEQRSVPGAPSMANSVASSTASDLSASTAYRKSELVQSYFDDAKK